MIGFLRRRQPGNRALAVLYWALLFLGILAALFVVFYFLDDFLPGAGQF